jgi:hypothetical protein
MTDSDLLRDLALFGHFLSTEDNAFVIEVGSKFVDRHQALSPEERERATKLREEIHARLA